MKGSVLLLRDSTGYTILELMVSLSVLAILTATATNLSDLYSTLQFRLSTNTLFDTVSAARETAVNTRRYTFLCPTSDTQTCSSSWPSQHYLLITDSNGNRKLDESDTIIRIIQIPKQIRVKWQAFGNKSTLIFTPEGVTNNQNGRFRLCDTTRTDLKPATIIVNKAGRARLHFQTNQKNFCP